MRYPQAGHRVTGVDLSDVQIRRARQLVPAAVFIRGDAISMSFAPTSFDAVVCLYTLIHMPLEAQLAATLWNFRVAPSPRPMISMMPVCSS